MKKSSKIELKLQKDNWKSFEKIWKVTSVKKQITYKSIKQYLAAIVANAGL